MDGTKLVFRNAVRAAEVVRLGDLVAVGRFIRRSRDQTVGWFLRTGQVCHMSSIGD
jgi:hypothetical protein